MLVFTVRLDEVEFCDTQQLLEEFLHKHDKYFERYVICHEIAEVTKKRHYQGWIEVTCSRSNWQEMIQIFQKYDKHQKSFKIMKKEEYRSYILKDDDLRYRKGVSDEEIEGWKSLSYKKDPTTKEKEPTSYEKITAFVQKKIENSSERPDGWKIAKWIMQYYHQNTKCEPNDFQIRNMAKSIWYNIKSKGDPNEFERYQNDRAMQIIGHEWIH